MCVWGGRWAGKRAQIPALEFFQSEEGRWSRKWQPTPVFLPGQSPWTEEPDGQQSMGLQRVRHIRVNEHICTRRKELGESQLCPLPSQDTREVRTW